MSLAHSLAVAGLLDFSGDPRTTICKSVPAELRFRVATCLNGTERSW
jgi:hypothetical protein